MDMLPCKNSYCPHYDTSNDNNCNRFPFRGHILCSCYVRDEIKEIVFYKKLKNEILQGERFYSNSQKEKNKIKYGRYLSYRRMCLFMKDLEEGKL